eukprot:6067450-Pyramimonas_sp.AAC.1
MFRCRINRRGCPARYPGGRSRECWSTETDAASGSRQCVLTDVRAEGAMDLVEFFWDDGYRESVEQGFAID